MFTTTLAVRSRFLLALAVSGAIGLAAFGPAGTADAHTPKAKGDCSQLVVSLESYDRGATAEIVVDGDVVHTGTFGGRLVTSYPTSGNREHTFLVDVVSTDRNRDGSSPYDFKYEATTTGCYTPPPPTPEAVTAKYDFSVPVCNRETWTVEGENLAVLYPTPGNVWTATKGAYSVTLALGEGYSGPPTDGFGTYTVTSADGDAGDLFDVQGFTVELTFIDPATLDCAPPPVDVCPNIDGTQETLPAGLVLVDGQCVTPPPVDVCPNLDGIQEELPAGYILQEGECVLPPPLDVCPNLEGQQLEVPAGYTVSESGECLPPVIVCDELHAPGVLDEYGNPTTCVSNDPCPDVATSPDCDPVPPVGPKPPTSLAITGADPSAPLIGGGIVLLLGLALLTPEVLRRIRARRVTLANVTAGE